MIHVMSFEKKKIEVFSQPPPPLLLELKNSFTCSFVLCCHAVNVAMLKLKSSLLLTQWKLPCGLRLIAICRISFINMKHTLLYSRLWYCVLLNWSLFLFNILLNYVIGSRRN